MIDFTDVYNEAYVESCCEHAGTDNAPATAYHEDAIRAVVAAAKAEALAEIAASQRPTPEGAGLQLCSSLAVMLRPRSGA